MLPDVTWKGLLNFMYGSQVMNGQPLARINRSRANNATGSAIYVHLLSYRKLALWEKC